MFALTASVYLVMAATKDLQFWVGDWNCVGEMTRADSTKQHTVAKNHVTLELKGHVIHEHFSMNDYRGESFSVYDEKNKLWRQTYVDNEGGYIVLTGGMSAGKMILTSVHKPDAKAYNRMVFHDIKAKSFVWDWERTDNNGTSWTLVWRLTYTRK